MSTSCRCAGWTTFAALLISQPLFAGVARGQTVRWTNPAGGAFGDGGNWDALHPPASTDTAAFGPPFSYVVTLAGTTTVANMVVDQGSPTIDGGGNRLNIGAVTPGPGDLTIAGPTASPASLTFMNGSLRIPLFGNLNLGVGAGTAGTMVLESGATMPIGFCNIGGAGTGYLLVRGTAADIGLPDTGGNGSVHLYPGSTVRVEGGSLVARLFDQLGGRLEVVGGSMNLQVSSSAGAGSWLFTGGATVHCGFPMRCTGTITVSGGATVAPVGAEYTAEILVTGAGSAINSESDITGVSSTLTVVDGGTVHWPGGLYFTGTPLVVVGATATVGPGGIRLDGGSLRVDQGAAVSFDTVQLGNAATLEVSFDGASLPTSPMITCTGSTGSSLAGVLSVRPSHPNNLHAGDLIEVIRTGAGGYQGGFSSLSAPDIGGRRGFLIEYSQTSVYVRVGPGTPCWTADFDGDGSVGTDADITAFFACLEGTCCPTCASADFDGNGTVGTDADIEAFFRILAGGPC